jgi:thymidylate synthase
MKRVQTKPGSQTVTPSPKKQRQFSDDSSPYDVDLPRTGARKNLFDHADAVHEPKKADSQSSAPLPSTQEPQYTQDDSACAPTEVKCFGYLYDEHDKNNTGIKVETSCFAIGRHHECDLVLDNECVSLKHCILEFDENETCTLIANKKCWVYTGTKEDGRWEKVLQDTTMTLVSGQSFRLLPAGTSNDAKSPGIEYRLDIVKYSSPKREFSGSYSFDVQYLNLLKEIQREGDLQDNKKGWNKTLRRSFTFIIDLSDESDRNILPLTSLRSLYDGRGAILEAIWYLRGEDNVKFLQENKNHFWDKDCDENGWLGYNYGLLTNFPQKDGKLHNQLEEKVLSRLCREEKSRNMVCMLIKPGEETTQVACTASIQFSVSEDGEHGVERLDLTISQRSSDAMVGLPHDVVVWSIILHLVRREVFLRTKRKLAAGNLNFIISGGGAHVYSLNADNCEKLLEREPKDCPQPFLEIKSDEPLFSLAKDFDKTKFVTRDYTGHHPGMRLSQAS